MAKVICTVCGRELDSRGLSGHMRTHKGKKDDTDGVISYPSNEQEIEETDTVVDSGATRAGHSVKQNDLDESQGKLTARSTSVEHPKNSSVKKTVKKQVKPASKPASKSVSKPASKPDADEQDKPYHKSGEWQGLFRD